jgi:hypothetical protein
LLTIGLRVVVEVRRGAISFAESAAAKPVAARDPTPVKSAATKAIATSKSATSIAAEAVPASLAAAPESATATEAITATAAEPATSSSKSTTAAAAPKSLAATSAEAASSKTSAAESSAPSATTAPKSAAPSAVSREQRADHHEQRYESILSGHHSFLEHACFRRISVCRFERCDAPAAPRFISWRRRSSPA